MLYLVTILPFLAVIPQFVFELDRIHSISDLLVVILFGSILLVILVGLWRNPIWWDHDRLGTGDGIVDDRFASPGSMAKHNWRKSIRRIPDDQDDDD
ncbi:hypothetical protein [Halococcoides cellulosivorans]|uniref:hypothetical protein n=1 Tax=Halococcoides cellulosivorans TaxID=1679096 RepID=UPI00131EFB2B|nr:hypothetical protein [Halococcoides cellulosivorans]